MRCSASARFAPFPTSRERSASCAGCCGQGAASPSPMSWWTAPGCRPGCPGPCRSWPASATRFRAPATSGCSNPRACRLLEVESRQEDAARTRRARPGSSARRKDLGPWADAGSAVFHLGGDRAAGRGQGSDPRRRPRLRDLRRRRLIREACDDRPLDCGGGARARPRAPSSRVRSWRWRWAASASISAGDAACTSSARCGSGSMHRARSSTRSSALRISDGPGTTRSRFLPVTGRPSSQRI